MRDVGLSWVRFVQKDVVELPALELFDAGVGRYILMYVKDPAAILEEIARLVRPGWVIAFLDTSFQSFLDEDTKRIRGILDLLGLTK